MTDPRDRDADAAIKDLFARVVAVAPPAPDLTDIRVAAADADAGADDASRRRRRRWVVASEIGLVAAAAAIIGLFVLPRSTPDTFQIGPADVGPTPTSPESSASSTGSEPPVDPEVSPSSTVTPETTIAAATTDVTPASLPPLPAAGPAISDLPGFVTGTVVVASDAGVEVRFADGRSGRITDEPAATAFLLADGDVVFQRDLPSGSADADTTPMRWDASDGTIAPLELLNPTGGGVRVFDVENVGEAPVLLYEATPAACNAGVDCDAALVTQVLSSGEAGEVDRINTFSGGWDGLSLARNGLIIGTSFNEISVELYARSIGAEAAPDAAAVGLPASFDDCSPTCPSSFGTDPAGRSVSWLAILDDGTVALLVQPLDGSPGAQVELPSEIGGFCDLDVLALAPELDSTPSGFVVVTCTNGSEAEAPVAVQIVDGVAGQLVALPVGATYDAGG